MNGPCDSMVLVDFPLADCAVVTINRPKAKNALSLALRRDLVRIFEQDLVGRARVVILTGAGGSFSAGLDMKELANVADVRQAITSEELDVARAVRKFDGPVIGAVDGPAITGGLELALACDLLLASDEACFADTHARVGVLPAWGLSQVLPRRIGEGRAKYLSLTGNFLDARRALAWGLVNEVLPREQLLLAAIQVASDMLSVMPAALRAYKALINDGAQLALGEALSLESNLAKAWSANLTAADLSQQRPSVLARGRQRVGETAQ